MYNKHMGCHCTLSQPQGSFTWAASRVYTCYTYICTSQLQGIDEEEALRRSLPESPLQEERITFQRGGLSKRPLADSYLQRRGSPRGGLTCQIKNRAAKILLSGKPRPFREAMRGGDEVEREKELLKEASERSCEETITLPASYR